MQENIEQDLKLIKEIKQKPYIIDNIINICLCASLYISENIVNLLPNVGNQVDLAHNRVLKAILVAIFHNSKHKAMIGVKKLPIKKKTRFRIASLIQPWTFAIIFDCSGKK